MRSLLILAEALGLLIVIAGVWRVLRRAKGPAKAGSLAAYDQPDATGADYTSDHHPHRHTSGHHHGAHSNSSDAHHGAHPSSVESGSGHFGDSGHVGGGGHFGGGDFGGGHGSSH
jgi:hypothetical protein